MSAIDLEKRPTLAPGVRLQNDKTTGEPVLLYPEGILVLNETAHEIVARCDGKTSVADIVTGLATAYESSSAELENDVADCLDNLTQRKLIVFAP